PRVPGSSISAFKEPIGMTLTTTTRPYHAATVSDEETTVRRFFAAWAAGDVAAAGALVDEDVVLGPIAGLLYAHQSYPGHTGVATAFGELAARWERFDSDVQETWWRDGQVIAVVQLAFEKHGMSSGGPITVACRLRDGRIASIVDDAA